MLPKKHCHTSQSNSVIVKSHYVCRANFMLLQAPHLQPGLKVTKCAAQRIATKFPRATQWVQATTICVWVKAYPAVVTPLAARIKGNSAQSNAAKFIQSTSIISCNHLVCVGQSPSCCSHPTCSQDALHETTCIAPNPLSNSMMFNSHLTHVNQSYSCCSHPTDSQDALQPVMLSM